MKLMLREVAIIAGVAADPGLLQYRLLPQIEVFEIRPLGASLLSAYLFAPPWLWKRRNWLLQHDVVHAHLTFALVLAAIIMAIRNSLGLHKPAIINTNHAVGMAIPKHRRWIQSKLMAGHDGSVVVAQDDYWNRYAFCHPSQLHRMIKNGVSFDLGIASDEAAQRESRRAIGIPDSCRVAIGTVGQLRADRQPWNFIPIFVEIAARLGPGVHFVIAGEGAGRERLEAAIAQSEIAGRVSLPGQVASAGTTAIAFDVYLTLAVGDAAGIAALEAIYAGVPVIGLQLDKRRQRNPSDLLWSSTSVAEIASQAVALSLDPVTAKRENKRQQEIATARHSVGAMQLAYDDVYCAVAAKRGL